MKTVGLITEYNPFHNGHLYHLQQAKEQTGADFVIVIMSGNFLQRGIPAMIDKYERTKMALNNGADLVVELPVPYACGSAEFFANGAIALLDKMNLVDHICFGSEFGKLDVLNQIAYLLIDEPIRFKETLNRLLKQGLAFPLARMQAACEYFEMSNNAEIVCNILSSPNNILGIEYLKALFKRNSTIKPCTVKRISADYHDLSLEHSICSASAIRESLNRGSGLDILYAKMPDNVFHILSNHENRTFPLSENDFSSILGYCLISSDLTKGSYYDVSDDLMNRIYNMRYEFTDFLTFAEQIKTKQYTRTHINRALFHILLNLKSAEVEQYIRKDYVQYIRILGFRKQAGPLLQKLKETSSLPLLTKIADADSKLEDSAYKMLHTDILASDLYRTAASSKFHTTFPNEYNRGLVILP